MSDNTNAIDLLISRLQPGDQVIILRGEGSPPVLEETTAIIWKVKDDVALTTGGIRLSRRTISDLILTNISIEEYLVSKEAQAIWNIVHDFVNSEEPESEPE